MAVAVKVTFVPAQTEVADAEMEMDGVTLGNTVRLKPFEVAVVGLTHEALLVITQVKKSLLAIELVTNELLLGPTLAPLRFHW